MYANPDPRRTLASSSRLTRVSPPTISGSLSKGSPDFFTTHAPEICPPSDAHLVSRIVLRDLSPLERALPDKHRVLPVFSRNSQTSSPLEATLTSIPVCVDFKWLTENPNPLDATLTENTGGGGPLLNGLCSVPPCLCGEPAGPIAGQSLWCNNSQRHRISSRSEETTPLSSVSKISERTSGTARSWSPSQVVPGSGFQGLYLQTLT